MSDGKLCVNCGEYVDEEYDTDDCPNINYIWREV